MDERAAEFIAPVSRCVQCVVPNPQRWMSREAVARQLDVSPVTVWRMVQTGSLPAYYAEGSSVAMYWTSDVERVAAAARLMRGRREGAGG